MLEVYVRMQLVSRDGEYKSVRIFHPDPGLFFFLYVSLIQFLTRPSTWWSRRKKNVKIVKEDERQDGEEEKKRPRTRRRTKLIDQCLGVVDAFCER